MNQTYKINLGAAARLLLGLFALGCVIVLFYFVPMWQAMQPESFLRWFSENGKKIGMIMLPLEMAPLVICLVLLVRSRHNGPARVPGLIVNGSNILILALFVAFFLPANNVLMDISSSPHQVPSILSDWKLFHGVRTILAVASFAFSFTAFGKADVRGVESDPGNQQWIFRSPQSRR